MKSALLLAAGLFLALGCRPAPKATSAVVYAPWETGLTLAYEDPRIPGEVRTAKRLQVRVSRTEPAPGGRIVELTFTTLRGQDTRRYLHRDGGVFLVDASGKPLRQILPDGFPQRTDRWAVEDNGVQRRNLFLGRATAAIPGLSLPRTVDPVGVWLETETVVPGAESVKLRTFLLPGIGEAETWEWEAAARRWTCISRLVARGFTDLPSDAPR